MNYVCLSEQVITALNTLTHSLVEFPLYSKYKGQCFKNWPRQILFTSLTIYKSLLSSHIGLLTMRELKI